MHRTLLTGIALTALALAPAHARAPQITPAGVPTTARKILAEGLLDVLEQSQKTGKGVLVYLGSHAIGGAVTKLTEATVELKNREYGRIVLRLDRIDGVAGN